MARCLITGANGFVGSHLAEAMLRAGHDVACLIRRTSDLRYIENLDVEMAYGELRDPASLRAAVGGRDIVIHNAAITRAFYPEEHFRINAGGTAAMLKACAGAAGKIKKFVFVSSQAAAGPSPTEEPIDEDHEPRPVSAYGRSKLMAEKFVMKYSRLFPVTIVRPSAVYGPRDTDMYATFKGAAGHIASVIGFGRSLISITHVSDIVQGIVRAAEAEAANGKTYFISYDRPYTCDEISGAVVEAVGARAVKLRVSGETVRAAARMITGLYRIGRTAGLCKKPPLMTIERGIELSRPFWVCDPSRAMREIGFAPRCDIETGFRDAVEWYRREGWL